MGTGTSYGLAVDVALGAAWAPLSIKKLVEQRMWGTFQAPGSACLATRV